MKKGFGWVLLAVFLMAFVAAEIEYPQIIVKVDSGKTALIRLLDVETGEKYDAVPLVQNYPGYSIADLIIEEPEVNVLVYLKDVETGEYGNPREMGPFPTAEDILLDYTGGVLRTLDLEEETVAEEVSTSGAESEGALEEGVEENTAEAVEEVSEEAQENPELAAGFSGAVVSGQGVKNSYFSWGIVAFVIVALGIFIMMQRKSGFKGTPEGRDVKLLESQVKRKGKAIAKIKAEVKRKERAEAAKRKLAVELAKEDTILSQLNASERDLEMKSQIDKEIDSSRRKGEFY